MCKNTPKCVCRTPDHSLQSTQNYAELLFRRRTSEQPRERHGPLWSNRLSLLLPHQHQRPIAFAAVSTTLVLPKRLVGDENKIYVKHSPKSRRSFMMIELRSSKCFSERGTGLLSAALRRKCHRMQEAPFLCAGWSK